MHRLLLINVILLAATAGCGDDGLVLEVDLRTDLVAGEEFVAVETALLGGPMRATPATALSDFVAGEPVASFEGLARGPVEVTVTLRDGAGTVVLRRTTRLDLTDDYGLIVVMSRRCGGVVCPAEGGDPLATECFGGECVEPTCRVGATETCGAAVCVGDADCTRPAGLAMCVTPLCASGACLLVAHDDLCRAGGGRCDPESGCTTSADGGVVVDGGECIRDSDCPMETMKLGRCMGMTNPCQQGSQQVTVTHWECSGGRCLSSDTNSFRSCVERDEGRSCGPCSVCHSEVCAVQDGLYCSSGGSA